MDAAVAIALILLFPVMLLMALIDVFRRPGYLFTAAGRTKGGTILAVLLTGGVGGLYYLLRIRPMVKRAARLTPAPARPPSDSRTGYRQYRKGDDPWSDRLGDAR